MANMEDRYSSEQKEGSAYCCKHRRYYRPDVGCPICRYEDSMLSHKGRGIPRIEKCPVCGEMSLVWYQCSNRCECLNLECRLQQVEAEY